MQSSTEIGMYSYAFRGHSTIPTSHGPIFRLWKVWWWRRPNRNITASWLLPSTWPPAYNYRLPLGYPLAPCLFNKCVDAVLQLLHDQGVGAIFYLDNLIVMTKSREWAFLHTARLLLHLTHLGFAINWKKSTPTPSQDSRWSICSLAPLDQLGSWQYANQSFH